MAAVITDPNPYRPLLEERLRVFEAELGVILPLDYREFLIGGPIKVRTILRSP